MEAAERACRQGSMRAGKVVSGQAGKFACNQEIRRAGRVVCKKAGECAGQAGEWASRQSSCWLGGEW
jgi:hypothetical protein